MGAFGCLRRGLYQQVCWIDRVNHKHVHMSSNRGLPTNGGCSVRTVSVFWSMIAICVQKERKGASVAEEVWQERVMPSPAPSLDQPPAKGTSQV